MNIVFRRSNGEIVGAPGYSLRPMTADDVAPEFDVITDAPDGTTRAVHYVSSGVATARPANPATIDTTAIQANGTDEATISGIESGATVTVTDANGQTAYVVTDGALEVTADEPGTIRIDVQGVFPTLDKSFTVTAS